MKRQPPRRRSEVLSESGRRRESPGFSRGEDVKNWNKVVTNMGRGMDPMSAYNRAEREEREEHRKRMERLRGAKPERKGGR